MSNRSDCKWCGFSYANTKQGREYLRHDEQDCEFGWLRTMLLRLLADPDDHMTACERTMGASHPCTCGATDIRRVLASVDSGREQS